MFCPPGRRIWRFRTGSSSCQQPPQHEEQVAKCEELRAVLGQPAIARLHMSELALDKAEGMRNLGPHLGPHLGEDPVDLCVDRIELAALWALRMTPRKARAFFVKTASRLAWTSPLSTQTEVSSPCNSSSRTWLSWVLAVVLSRLWTMPLSAFTPTWAFMPKYQPLPFFVDDISRSRALALLFVEDGASRSSHRSKCPSAAPRPCRQGRRLPGQRASRLGGSSECPMLPKAPTKKWLVRNSDFRLANQPSQPDMNTNIDMILNWKCNVRPVTKL